MDLMRLSIERIVALVVLVLQVTCALLFSTVSPSIGIVAGSAFLLSLPGLAMIWFREGLGFIGFSHGRVHDSPPLLVDLFGWLFLIGLPVIFLYNLLP